MGQLVIVIVSLTPKHYLVVCMKCKSQKELHEAQDYDSNSVCVQAPIFVKWVMGTVLNPVAIIFPTLYTGQKPCSQIWLLSACII